MKLHSDYLKENDVFMALRNTRDSGLMQDTIGFTQFAFEGSRSHRVGYLIQLGTYDQIMEDGKKRHYKNSGYSGADSDSSLWAATYDEWGWFISAIFTLDPDAKFGYYKNAKHFHEMTKSKFELEG
jgi:hypothetical protein